MFFNVLKSWRIGCTNSRCIFTFYSHYFLLSLHVQIGGIEHITLGDQEVRRRNNKKIILERKSSPTFPFLIEIRERHYWVVHRVSSSSLVLQLSWNYVTWWENKIAFSPSLSLMFFCCLFFLLVSFDDDGVFWSSCVGIAPFLAHPFCLKW